jgi:hypothetical protein
MGCPPIAMGLRSLETHLGLDGPYASSDDLGALRSLICIESMIIAVEILTETMDVIT